MRLWCFARHQIIRQIFFLTIYMLHNNKLNDTSQTSQHEHYTVEMLYSQQLYLKKSVTEKCKLSILTLSINVIDGHA